MKKKKKNKDLYLHIGIGVFLIIVACTPWLLTRKTFLTGFTTDTGAIGDTIGGITAPFINLLAAFLVWISFKEQVKANKILSKETNYNYIKTLYKDFNLDYDTFYKINSENLTILKTVHFNNIIYRTYEKFYDQYIILTSLYKDYRNIFNSLEFITNEIKNSDNLEDNLKESLLFKIQKTSIQITQYIHIIKSLLTFIELNDNIIQANLTDLNTLATFNSGFNNFNDMKNDMKLLLSELNEFKNEVR